MMLLSLLSEGLPGLVRADTWIRSTHDIRRDLIPSYCCRALQSIVSWSVGVAFVPQAPHLRRDFLLCRVQVEHAHSLEMLRWRCSPFQRPLERDAFVSCVAFTDDSSLSGHGENRSAPPMARFGNESAISASAPGVDLAEVGRRRNAIVAVASESMPAMFLFLTDFRGNSPVQHLRLVSHCLLNHCYYVPPSFSGAATS
jgi:hypothetical protein